VSLIPANIEYLGFAIQADKDTPAAAPLICVALEDCSLDPGVDVITLAESDQSAQQGDRAVVGASPGGTFKKYLRPSEEDFFLYCLLGKNTDSGTTPKIHTASIDPAAPFDSPYLTVWDVWPGVLTVRYDGVRIGRGAFTSQPRQAWEAEYTLAGLKATYGVSEPDPTGLFADELPFTWPELTATLGGVHDGVVNSCQLTVDRNTGRFEGDNGLTSLDVPNGLLAITGALEVAFQNDDLTRAANTGATSGTVLTTTLFYESLVIALARGANLGTTFTLADVGITDFKNQLKTDGTPAVSTFNFYAKRQADILDTLTTVVKNAIALAARA
jgi:hypothetical protein